MPPANDPKSRIPQLRSADIDEMPATSGVFASLWAKFREATGLNWPWSKIDGAPASLPPSGPAGGVLSGNYPNPGFAVNMAEQSELDAEAQARADADTALGNTIQQLSDDTDAALAAKANLDSGKHRLSEIPGWTPLTVTSPTTSVQLATGGKYVLSVLDDGTGGEVTVNLPAGDDQAWVAVYVDHMDRDAYVPVFGTYLEGGQVYEFFHTPDSGWVSTNRPYDIPWLTPLSRGGTGAENPSGARTALGLGNNYATGAISAAGNTTVSAWGSARLGQRKLTVGAGSGAFEATVTLSTSGATSGDIGHLDLWMPASLNPSITVRNATSTGTNLLVALGIADGVVPRDATVARAWRVTVRYTGSEWEATGIAPLNWQEATRALVNPVANSRQARRGVRLNGAYVSLADLSAQWTIGTGDFAISVIVRVSAHGSPQSRYVAGNAGSSDAIISQSDTGTWVVGSDAAQAYLVDTQLPLLTEQRITISRAAGVISLYRDRALVGTVASGASLTPPRRINGQSDGYGMFVGDVLGLDCYNYALNAAQVARLFATGAVDPVDMFPGGVRELSTTAWTLAGTGTVTSSSGAAFDYASTAGANALGASFAIRKGQRVEVSGTLSSLAGGSLQFYLFAGGLASDTYYTKAANGTFDFSVTAVADTIVTPVFNGTVEGVSYSVTGITITPLAALVALDPQWDGLGTYWPSIDGRGNHAPLGAGVQPLMRKVRGEVAPELFGPPPILSVTLTAGQSITSGDVLAEVSLPDGYGPAHGMWYLGNHQGGRFYIGGNYSDGGSVLGVTPVSLGDSGRFGNAYGCYSVALGIVSASASDTRVRIVAGATDTVASTHTIYVIPIVAGLRRELVK